MRPLQSISAALLLATISVKAQNLQLHYDQRNYPTIYFEYFKKQDTAAKNSTRITPGACLVKIQSDLLGPQHNIGKFYLQICQSFRFWQPKIYVSLQYSGGAGLTEPKQYSYYIQNTYSAGVEYPFQYKGAYFTMQLYYRATAQSHDLLYTLYWWKGFFHYKLEVAGDFSVWTQRHGAFFAEPQVWYNLNKTLALGSKLNLHYHVNIQANVFQTAPTIAIRCRL